MTKIVLALLVLTMLGYVGVYAYKLANDTTQTAVAVHDVWRECVNVTGVLVREETVLTGKRSYCSVTAVHGGRVAVGEELGLAYDSAQSLQRAQRLESLDREIELVETVLSGAGQTDGTERADAARSAVLSFSADIARHDMSDIRLDALRLCALLFGDGADFTAEQLESMRRERRALLRRAAGETDTLLAPASGIFTPLVDGFEKLNPAALTNLTVPALQTLLAHCGDVDARSYGKLVPNFNWYLAAFLSEKDVSRLRVGSEFVVDLSRYRADEPRATLQSISESEGGICVAVFSCTQSLTDTLQLRSVSCPVVVSTVAGLRLPAQAVRRDDTGGTYVLLAGGVTVHRADVSVLREDGEYVLVSGETLREGSTVLLGSRVREGQSLS